MYLLSFPFFHVFTSSFVSKFSLFTVIIGSQGLDGEDEGVSLGLAVGSEVGTPVGLALGDVDGNAVGTAEGLGVG